MSAELETTRTELTAVVGASAISDDAAARRALAVDGLEPELIAYPRSADQVAQVLKCAADHGLAVIPVRNGTKLAIGNPPRRYAIALSLKEMNRVWHYEPADLTVTVEPGMKLGDFQHFLARQGLWLPLDPRGGARASIGGILAANAAGPLRFQYGGPRDMTLGMKIATSDGRIIKAGGRVVKNVAGYDIVKLLIGSYGTLGVIVEASFKLFPRPAGQATFILAAPDLDVARGLRRRILSSSLHPMRMALLDRWAAERVRQGTPLAMGASRSAEFELWVEAGGSPRVLARYGRELEELARDAGVLLEEAEEAEAAWKGIADFASVAVASFPATAILRATLPLDSSEEFLRSVRKEGREVACACLPGTGVVHLALMSQRSGTDSVQRWVSNARAGAEALGGALVVEHCRHELKASLDVWGRPGNDFEMMKKIKAVWDPKGVLSPGRFVGGI